MAQQTAIIFFKILLISYVISFITAIIMMHFYHPKENNGITYKDPLD